MRSSCVFVTTGFLAWRFGGLYALRVRDPRGQLGRGVLSILGTVLFVYGLKFLSLADAIVIGFAGPIFVTVMGPCSSVNG